MDLTVKFRRHGSSPYSSSSSSLKWKPAPGSGPSRSSPTPSNLEVEQMRLGYDQYSRDGYRSLDLYATVFCNASCADGGHSLCIHSPRDHNSESVDRSTAPDSIIKNPTPHKSTSPPCPSEKLRGECSVLDRPGAASVGAVDAYSQSMRNHLLGLSRRRMTLCQRISR
jgi:hypothetical protein